MTYPIKGFLETSFVDWDGRIAAVIFLGGCNFRCPFCYNVSLVLEPDKNPNIDWAVVSEYLETHRDWLDGVVVTGGEPTIWPGLPDLLRELKGFGLPVKLDTNGSRPEIVSQLLAEGLAEHIALDYKAPLDDRYYRAAGCPAPSAGTGSPSVVEVGLPDRIRRTISILLASHLPVEFRTTAVPGFLDEDGLRKMAQDLKDLWQQARRDAPALIADDQDRVPFKFVLQPFKPANALDKDLRLIKPFSNEQMFKFERLVSSILGRCQLR